MWEITVPGTASLTAILTLIPPNTSEVICHFRSQVKRGISSVWSVKHLKAAQQNHQRIKLGSFIVCLKWSDKPQNQHTRAIACNLAPLLETEKLLQQNSTLCMWHGSEPCNKQSNASEAPKAWAEILFSEDHFFPYIPASPTFFPHSFKLSLLSQPRLRISFKDSFPSWQTDWICSFKKSMWKD